MLKKIFILITFLGSILNIKSQDTDYRLSLFLVGVSANVHKNHKITLYSGHNPMDNIDLFRTAISSKINNHISISSTYTYSDTDYEKNKSHTEHQLSIAGTLSFPISKDKKWTFSDRNTYFYKIRNYSTNVSFYRNRFGINYKMSLFKRDVNLFLYDEIYFNITKNYFSRNQISIGGDIKLPWFTPQLIYLYQLDKDLPSSHLFNFSITIPIENFYKK